MPRYSHGWRGFGLLCPSCGFGSSSAASRPSWEQEQQRAGAGRRGSDVAEQVLEGRGVLERVGGQSRAATEDLVGELDGGAVDALGERAGRAGGSEVRAGGEDGGGNDVGPQVGEQRADGELEHQRVTLGPGGRGDEDRLALEGAVLEDVEK